MFLNEGKLANMLPPYQQRVSLLEVAYTLVLISFGKALFNSFTKRSGKPSIRVFPPLKTISL